MFDLGPLIIGTSLTIIIALVVFLKDKRSATNQLFFLLALSLTGWSITTYFSLHTTNDVDTLFWIRMIMFIVVIQNTCFYLLAHIFPSRGFDSIRNWPKLIAIFYSFLTAIVALSPYLFTDFRDGSPIPGAGMVLFLPHAIIFAGGGLALLIMRYRRSKGITKTQLKYFLVGTLAMFTLVPIGNFVIPLVFGFSQFVVFSPLYAIIFSLLIAYGIVKHHLFNLKIIATEALIIIIWLLLFSKIFLSDSTPERVVDVATLVITIPFGILLIRSVVKEVRLAEQQYEMVATVSHQLRTPLTPVLGYAAMMDQGDFDGHPKELKDAEHNLFISTQRLRNIINDFLQIFELEGEHKIEAEKTTLKQLVEESMAGVQENYKQKNLYLKLENPNNVDVPITGEVKLLVQAVNNLLDNAQRYTQEGGTTITLGIERNRAIIKVHDTGIGLDDKDKERLFSKFYRSDAAKEVRPDGSGLGLPIVKNVIESHGGRVRAESEGRGKGTTFIIELPIKGR